MACDNFDMNTFDQVGQPHALLVFVKRVFKVHFLNKKKKTILIKQHSKWPWDIV